MTFSIKRDMTPKEMIAEMNMRSAPGNTTNSQPEIPRDVQIFREYIANILNFHHEYKRLPTREAESSTENIIAGKLEKCRAAARDNSTMMNILRREDPDGIILNHGAAAEIVIGGKSPLEMMREMNIRGTGEDRDITKLVHVRSNKQRVIDKAAERRDPCPDFDEFKAEFESVQDDLAKGRRVTRKVKKADTREFRIHNDVKKGIFFILNGQIALVVRRDELSKRNDAGKLDTNLRVIFDNGTQSKMLMTSFRKALLEDENGRYILDPNDAGALFRDADDPIGDSEVSGSIYVAQSEHPQAEDIKDFFHKIGFTTGSAQDRIARAETDPTFLLAPATLVDEYQLANINPRKLESLIHAVLAEARADISLPDRFGREVQPREWFLVDRWTIKEIIDKLRDGTLGNYRFNKTQQKLVSIEK